MGMSPLCVCDPTSHVEFRKWYGKATLLYSRVTTYCVVRATVRQACVASVSLGQWQCRASPPASLHSASSTASQQHKLTKLEKLPSNEDRLTILAKKSTPYLITERRVLELIPVLGCQPAVDMSHKPGGKLPLLSARPAVTIATLERAATNFAAWWTEARWVWTVCLTLLPNSVTTAIWTQALLLLSPAR